MPYDLSSALADLRTGRATATQWMEHSIAAAQSPANAHVFARTLFDSAHREAAAARPEQPLAGLAVSVKDLFDVRGLPSCASSLALADAPPAQTDAPAVARLRAAGGAIIGKTHMVEFAFSGVGVNPHHGTPAAVDALGGTSATPARTLSGAPRVSGGSSSGAAVSVATGAAFVGLGSDTGGSIRIPAALNGIVGFKNTARLVPTRGAVPLSTTLDTACALTRSVRDAIVVHEILAARRVTRSPMPIAGWRLAVPTTLFFEGIEPAVAQAFERSLAVLRRAGAQITEIALPMLNELPQINATGGFSTAESYAWHRPLLARRAAQYDPRVRSRIERGAQMSAADYIDLTNARADWITRMESALNGFDALLSPTVPITAPTLASVAPANGHDAAADAARDAEFFRVNGLLLRNTNAVNMLDGCALSLPCHQPGELPTGLMVWHAALHDDAVLNVSLRIEEELQKQ
jgi:aspartyl-tRNA(Asn)/glutamyl-tRNA(Gln) amidotransferase subunit A